MLNPVLIEIVAPMLSTPLVGCCGYGLMSDALGIRDRCHRQDIDEYPDDWKEATAYLTRWVNEILRLYRHRVRIRIVDAQSLVGLWKQLRYRVFRFPAFIVDKKKTYVGWDYAELETIIDERMHSR